MQGKTRTPIRASSPSSAGFNEAPAKCRGKQGRSDRDIDMTSLASMRPPRNAGENPPRSVAGSRSSSRFNEAPAKCRGKPVSGEGLRTGFKASMRPPRNAGENIERRAASAASSAGFNEAPAKCRGKQDHPCVGNRSWRRFNEAPAKCRGKRRSSCFTNPLSASLQ